MLNSARIWLVAAALLAGLLMAACGGGDNGDNGNGEEPAATATAGDMDNGGGAEATVPASDEGNGGSDGGGEAFADVPVPSGADETGSGSFSSSDIPFFVPGDEVDPEAYTSIDYKEYDSSDSPEDIIAFYKDELSDWDEVFVFSGGDAGDEGGFGVWTRDDGREAVWVGASISDGTTDLILIVGAQE
jgi:hypothetical protein